MITRTALAVGDWYSRALVRVILLFLPVAPYVSAQQLYFDGPAPLNSTAVTDGAVGDGLPSVATDAMGTWITVWISDNSLGAAGDTDYDILYARSLDEGTTWSAAAKLNSNADTDSQLDSHPVLAGDGYNNWLAVWESNENLGGVGTDTDIFVARSISNGQSWLPVQVLNSSALGDSKNDFYPSVATNSQGRWLVAWESVQNLGGIGEDSDILFAYSDTHGSSWTAAAPLNTSAPTDTGGDRSPRVANHGSTWITVWYGEEAFAGSLDLGTDWDVFYARSTDGGVTWDDPAPLNSRAAGDTGFDAFPDIAADSVGNWVAVWQSNENPDGLYGADSDIWYAVSTDDGATWSPQAVLNGNAAIDGSAGDTAPHIACDRRGAWLAVWESEGGTDEVLGADRDILMAVSIDNAATWGPVAPVNESAGDDNEAAENGDFTSAIAADKMGNYVAVWGSKYSLSVPDRAQLGTDTDVLVATVAPPRVSGTFLGGPSPTNEENVEFGVLFTRPVLAVDIGDFALDAHNLAGEVITGIRELSGVAWVVEVDAGEGCGVMQLDVLDDDSITDAYGNPLAGIGVGNGDVEGTETFNIVRTPPVITLDGQNPLYVECGHGSYMFPGTTATDCLDGDISGDISISGALDTDVPGEYTWTYDVTNSLGNQADSVVRTLIVHDTLQLTILGDNPLAWECGVPYADPGATVTDFCAPDPVLEIDASLVDIRHSGSYMVTITASDPPNNSVVLTRTVNVAGVCPGGEGEGEGESLIHTGDQNGDHLFSLNELLRIIQFYNSGGLYCAASPGQTEDGFVPGAGADHACNPHDSDYHPSGPDWTIGLTELLRCIQFFNSGGYHACPSEATEDGFCPGQP